MDGIGRRGEIWHCFQLLFIVFNERRVIFTIRKLKLRLFRGIESHF